MGIFNKFFRRVTPRYHLALDKKIYDDHLKIFYYRFKIFGTYSFTKYTFSDIEKDYNIAYEINPYDLIEIAINEYKYYKKKKVFKIIECLRDNQYKISNSESTEIINGDDLLYDSFLVNKIRRRDIRTICINTGLLQGRNISKKISHQNNKKTSKIFELKILP